ncbi:MAG: isoprenyl transferase [Gammaproteobacteria bacterium]|nr:isoprenyl transferase [Gammaproteobacteria bacterium]
MGNKLSAVPDVELTVVPKHVAIIMDGNGRWAKKRFLKRVAGHKAGVDTVKMVIETSAQLGVEVVTFFAFSSENWNRPRDEVSTLMDLFVTSLEKEVAQLHEKNIRLRFIGDRSRFSEKLQKRINEAEKLTCDNQGMQIVIAANYGGKWDITDAVRKIAQQIRKGSLEPEDISEELIQNTISLGDLPEPDFFIRTSGEHRISNFMIWQLAYTELYFTDIFWPDFDRVEYVKALKSFADRERRFGKTGEQVAKLNNA